MSFYNKLIPSVKSTNKENYTKYFLFVVSAWFDSLKRDVYKSNYSYNLQDYIITKKHNVEYDNDYYTAEQIEIEKNFIKHELKHLNSLLNWFIKVYEINYVSFYEISNEIRPTNEQKEFIKRCSNDHRYLKENYLSNINFLIDFVFIDFRKTKSLLDKKLKKIIKEQKELNLIIQPQQLQSKEDKQTETNSNLYPDIFKDGAFLIFKKWVDKSTDENQKKISFIFQKLKRENLLRTTNFKPLVNWSFNNGFIDEESCNKLLTNGCFISPSKILTKSRLELYNSIIGN